MIVNQFNEDSTGLFVDTVNLKIIVAALRELSVGNTEGIAKRMAFDGFKHVSAGDAVAVVSTFTKTIGRYTDQMKYREVPKEQGKVEDIVM